MFRLMLEKQLFKTVSKIDDKLFRTWNKPKLMQSVCYSETFKKSQSAQQATSINIVIDKGYNYSHSLTVMSNITVNF